MFFERKHKNFDIVQGILLQNIPKDGSYQLPHSPSLRLNDPGLGGCARHPPRSIVKKVSVCVHLWGFSGLFS